MYNHLFERARYGIEKAYLGYNSLIECYKMNNTTVSCVTEKVSLADHIKKHWIMKITNITDDITPNETPDVCVWSL